MSLNPLSENSLKQLAQSEQKLSELFSNLDVQAKDCSPLISEIVDIFDQTSIELANQNSPQAMAWLDVFSLASASLSSLNLRNGDVDLILDRIGSLMLILSFGSEHDSIITLLDWLQPNNDYSLLDIENRLRLEKDLLQIKPIDDDATSLENKEPQLSNSNDIDSSAIVLNEDQTEVLKLIGSELEDMEEQHNELFNDITADDRFSDEISHLILSLSSRYEHLGNVCAMVSLNGLSAFFRHCQINLEELANAKHWSVELTDLINQSRKCCHNYVSNHLSHNYANEIIELWCHDSWSLKINKDNDSALLHSLIKPDMGDLNDERPPRQTQATPEDVSLALPEDVNQDLLESLLQELPDQTAELSASLISCIKNQFISDLDAARRIAHTVKGAANVVGVRGIANITHHMEDMLDFLAKYNQPPAGDMAETLLGAADCLEAMCEYLLGQSEIPSDAQVVLQQILDWANLLDKEGKNALALIKQNDVPIKSESNSKILPDSESGSDDKVDSQNDSHNQSSSEAEKSLRVSYSLIDNLMRLAGEHTILSGQIQEHTDNSLKHMNNVKLRSNYLRNVALELEQLVDVKRVGINSKKDSQSNELDSLELEEYNELHTVTHRLAEAVSDVHEHIVSIENELQKLSDANVDQGRMNNQQQDAVMQTRMVSVQSVVPRLQRSVRQACRISDKQAELKVSGTSTLIDNDILTSLIDPIMHLLRNAVDHGIENRETRLRQGKPESGVINLEFSRRGDQILVSCRDDGAGFDFDKIRQKGFELNLIQSDMDYTNEELSYLILTPGFSTKSDISQLSGRGVGLDVVNAQVTKLKGTLNASSERSQGSKFEIVLPTSLLAAHALLVEAATKKFVVTSHGIDEILFTEAGEISYIADELVYTAGDEAHKVIALSTLLNIPAKEIQLHQPHTLMIVEVQLGKRVAVLVDKVISSRDIVIKPLGDYLPKIAGVVGATILGDGSAVSVLELAGLARADQSSSLNISALAEENTENDVSILVVDDSLSARRSLVQFVEDMGIQVKAAKDGIEAIDFIKLKRPTLILADLEMPRMNGLELTTHIRSQEDTKQIPIIMITSRATDKHKKMAESAGVNAYLNKPYSEDELLRKIHAYL